MKKLLLLLALALSLMAEMSFDQVQELIKKKQYNEALISLEVIQKNHPNESIVYYAQAQAKAGFGDLRGAKSALDRAEALNPKLSYAKPEAVKALKIAIEPRIDLVKTFEREDTKLSIWVILISVLSIIATGAVALVFMFRKKPEEVVEPVTPYKPSEPYRERPETFSKGYGVKETFNPNSAPVYRPDVRPYSSTTEVHHHHHNSGSGNTVAAGLAGVAAGVAVASMFDDTKHSTQHEVDSIARIYNPEPEDNSWKGSNSYKEEKEDNSWKDSNSSSDSSWGSSSSSSDDSWSSSSSSSDYSWSDSSSSSSSSGE